MKMLAVAQNPGGSAISAQEFATARQDLTTLLANTGYVPEQVAAINERVRVSEADASPPPPPQPPQQGDDGGR